MSDIIRIGNCSGFYGDRLKAALEMVEGGPIDVLTGDYLAELTMKILYDQREQRGAHLGYVGTFLKQLEEVVAACLDRGIKIVTNAGGPPPGMWTDWGREDFVAALDANMLTPIALMQALVPHMQAQGWGRVVNITSQSVKAPIPVLGLSNSARAGLTGFVAGTARQVAPSGVTINNLQPGIHATDRAVSLDAGVTSAQGISSEEAQKQREATIPTRRYGTAEEFGETCAFLCSQYAGFIVGQNILLDGGAVNSTM